MSEQPEVNMWRIDKHVPLALLFAIGVQTVGIAWWAAGVQFRIGELEQRASTAAQNADRLTRLEVKFEAALEALKEIKSLVSRDHH